MNPIKQLLKTGWTPVDKGVTSANHFIKYFPIGEISVPIKITIQSHRLGNQWHKTYFELSLVDRAEDRTFLKLLQWEFSEDINQVLESIPRMLATMEFYLNEKLTDSRRE